MKVVLVFVLLKIAIVSSSKSLAVLAIACNTRNVTIDGKQKTIVSRVTVVDEEGQPVYDAKVKPILTKIRDEKYSNEDYSEFHKVKQMIHYITSCRLLVGHNLTKVLNLFQIDHPVYLLRDIMLFYSSCKNLPDVGNSLKSLTKTLLGRDIAECGHNTSENAIASMEIYRKYREQWEKSASARHKTAFALDCEMIECVVPGRIRREVVAKLSIVDHLGEVVYDQLFKPELPVKSYRTFVTGLRSNNFTDAVYLSDERERLKSLLKGNIVVGHAVGKDLALLGIHHPFTLTRDSSTFDVFCSYFPNKRTPSLKELAGCLLNMTIQNGHHDSSEDAHATMMLYLKYREDWDEQVAKIAHLFVSD